MNSDEIIREVWRNRDSYAEQHHRNLKEIVADLCRRQKNPHGNVVDRRAKNRCTNEIPADKQ